MSISWDILKSPELEERACRCLIEPGLEVYVLVKKGYRKKYAIFSTRFGSIDSRFQVEGSDQVIDVPDGVAHFRAQALKMNRGCDGAVCRPAPQRFYHFHPYHLPFLGHGKFPRLPAADFVQEPTSPGRRCRRSRGSSGQDPTLQDHPQWRVFFNLLEALRPSPGPQISPVPWKASPDPRNCSMTATGPYHPSNMALLWWATWTPARWGSR